MRSGIEVSLGLLALRKRRIWVGVVLGLEKILEDSPFLVKG
jgi:hypothetical protein